MWSFSQCKKHIIIIKKCTVCVRCGLQKLLIYERWVSDATKSVESNTLRKVGLHRKTSWRLRIITLRMREKYQKKYDYVHNTYSKDKISRISATSAVKTALFDKCDFTFHEVWAIFSIKCQICFDIHGDRKVYVKIYNSQLFTAYSLNVKYFKLCFNASYFNAKMLVLVTLLWV